MPQKRKKPPMEIVRLNKALPRLELATALEMTGGLDEGHLAKLLRSSGESAGKNISTLAAAIGIPYKRVVECYRDMKRMEGVVAVAQRLPKMLQDVVEDAENKRLTCGACEGLGEIVVKRDSEGLPVDYKKCIPCEGLGSIVKSGDPVARKQVLEIMEMTGKAPIWAPGSNIVALGESLEDTLRNARRGGSNGSDRMERTINGDQQDVGESGSGAGTDSPR